MPIPMFDLLHSFRTCGYFNCDYEQGWFSRTLYNFRISMTDYYDFTPKQFEDILVHEMIHYYLAYFGIDKSISHGREFKKMAKRLNQAYGLMMENIIYNEMRYRRFLVDVGNVNIRVRNEKGELQRVTLEVDFVCNLGSRKYYLQSAYRLPDEEKMRQEKRSLTH